MCLVYVVDDEQPILELISDVLEEMGCTVYAAKTGIDALTLVDEYGRPDLVITDLMMPFMDGRELYAFFRNQADLADVPIIVMTAATERSLRFDGPWPPVIFKPFDIELFEELVVDVLGLQHSHHPSHAA
jgi:two-component system, sensor histidine kinase and response regulator